MSLLKHLEVHPHRVTRLTTGAGVLRIFHCFTAVMAPLLRAMLFN